MNISISQTDRRTVISAVAQVAPFITVIHDADTTLTKYCDVIRTPFQYRIDIACMLGILHTKLI